MIFGMNRREGGRSLSLGVVRFESLIFCCGGGGERIEGKYVGVENNKFFYGFIGFRSLIFNYK